MSRVSDFTHRLQDRVRELMAQNENQVFMALTIVIGALVGLTVVAFILVTDGRLKRIFLAASEWFQSWAD